MTGTPDLVNVVLDGFDSEDKRAIHDVRKLFGLDPMAAERFVRSTPCVVKRSISREEARRYVKVLRTIGGRAEIRISKPSVAPPGASLPSPKFSSPVAAAAAEHPDMSDPMVRWRASEDQGRSIPTPSNELAEQIPKAPRLPDDLLRSTGGQTPGWMSSDPLDTSIAESSASPARLASRHPITGAPHSIGMTENSKSVAPPGSSRPRRLTSKPAPPRGPRWQLLAGLLIVVGICLGAAHQAGLFDQETRKLRKAMTSQGIEADRPFAPFQQWYNTTGNRFEGKLADRVPTFADACSRAGAPQVWVMGISQAEPGETARRLVVELPLDQEGRRKILWQTARFLGHEASVTEDRGLRFLEVSF